MSSRRDEQSIRYVNRARQRRMLKREFVRALIAGTLIAVFLACIVFIGVAEACACEGNDPEGFVEFFNAKDASTRCTANVVPPAGWVWGGDGCTMVPNYYQYS